MSSRVTFVSEDETQLFRVDEPDGARRYLAALVKTGLGGDDYLTSHTLTAICTVLADLEDTESALRIAQSDAGKT